jgi:glycosyltransferase involved in cell wall biosynthesis
LQILTRFLRPPSIAALQQGRWRDGWKIYAASWNWHLRLGRIKYLLGFPLLGVLSSFKGERHVRKHLSACEISESGPMRQRSGETDREPSMKIVPRITIMIATHNRVSELAKTLESCLAQSGPTAEILVVDDASTDGTYDAVRSRFPQVDVVRNERNKGSIASRNDILRRARGDYVIALDDDSRFVDSDACQRIVSRMDAEPDLGIIAFQVIGPENPATMRPEGRHEGEWHCSSFACCAAVLRRSMFEKTGPLAEIFYHSYEEPDLALRAWDAGYRVLQWNEIVVYHEFSGLNRNEARNHSRHARNEACGVVMRYPWYLVVPGVLAKLAGQARYAAHRGWLLKEPRVWFEFLWKLPGALRHRRAVRAQTLKIVTGLNRQNCTGADNARRLAALPWSEVIFGTRAGAAPAALANAARDR